MFAQRLANLRRKLELLFRFIEISKLVDLIEFSSAIDIELRQRRPPKFSYIFIQFVLSKLAQKIQKRKTRRPAYIWKKFTHFEVLRTMLFPFVYPLISISFYSVGLRSSSLRTLWTHSSFFSVWPLLQIQLDNRVIIGLTDIGLNGNVAAFHRTLRDQVVEKVPHGNPVLCNRINHSLNLIETD